MMMVLVEGDGKTGVILMLASTAAMPVCASALADGGCDAMDRLVGSMNARWPVQRCTMITGGSWGWLCGKQGS